MLQLEIEIDLPNSENIESGTARLHPEGNKNTNTR